LRKPEPGDSTSDSEIDELTDSSAEVNLEEPSPKRRKYHAEYVTAGEWDTDNDSGDESISSASTIVCGCTECEK